MTVANDMARVFKNEFAHVANRRGGIVRRRMVQVEYSQGRRVSSVKSFAGNVGRPTGSKNARLSGYKPQNSLAGNKAITLGTILL